MLARHNLIIVVSLILHPRSLGPTKIAPLETIIHFNQIPEPRASSKTKFDEIQDELRKLIPRVCSYSI